MTMPDTKNEPLVPSGRDSGKPAEPSLPKLNICGEIGLKIARDGTWFYAGTQIGRKPLVKLFASVLRREKDGFYLVTPVEKVPIEVEGEPFVAVAMSREGKGKNQILTFTTSVDHGVRRIITNKIDFRALKQGGNAPYIEVRDGLTARLARPVYYELAELAVDAGEGLGVWSGGTFFPFPMDA